jgi:hypothetical protein
VSTGVDVEEVLLAGILKLWLSFMLEDIGMLSHKGMFLLKFFG